MRKLLRKKEITNCVTFFPGGGRARDMRQRKSIETEEGQASLSEKERHYQEVTEDLAP